MTDHCKGELPLMHARAESVGRDTYPAHLGMLLDGLLAGAAQTPPGGTAVNPEASA